MYHTTLPFFFLTAVLRYGSCRCRLLCDFGTKIKNVLRFGWLDLWGGGEGRGSLVYPTLMHRLAKFLRNPVAYCLLFLRLMKSGKILDIFFVTVQRYTCGARAGYACANSSIHSVDGHVSPTKKIRAVVLFPSSLFCFVSRRVLVCCFQSDWQSSQKLQSKFSLRGAGGYSANQRSLHMETHVAVWFSSTGFVECACACAYVWASVVVMKKSRRG